LDRASSVDPRQVWKWVTAPWLHASNKEALLNTVVLGILLFNTSLPLREVMLRYSLTGLACLALAVQTSRWCHIKQVWGGASGVVASLLSMDSILSLLRWQRQGFEMGPLQIPVWVLLWIWVTIQITWTIPRRHGGNPSKPWHRVLSSCWFWGLGIGTIWGITIWLLGLAK